MRVAIIHPWFPQYRLGFFENLVREGAEQGIQFEIFYGECPPEWKDRDDAVSTGGFTQLATRFLNLRGRTLNIKSLKRYFAQDAFDLVIVEQAVRNLETYRLLLRREPLAFWGHGRTYTLKIGARQELLKQWLTRRGKWFFAYTPGGADAVVEAGFPHSRTTIVQNSIDTTALRLDLESVTEDEIEKFKAEHDLTERTALFIGGLDSSKRLEFLLESAAIAYKNDPKFRLVIAGAGAQRGMVEKSAAGSTHITYLGSLFGKDKALAMRASQVLAMPGRVGLVAVDSFVARVPIITTHWEWHAPEFEYLKSGVNSVVTKNATKDYARGLNETLQNVELMNSLRRECSRASAQYTSAAMVENFLRGVHLALGESK